MPVYNSQFFENLPDGGHKISPLVLATIGPVLAVSVSIPQALAELYTYFCARIIKHNGLSA